MRLRHARTVLAALTAAVILATTATPAAAARPLEWGTSTIRGDLASIQALERDHGRDFTTVRVFVRWDSEFPTQYHRDLKAAGYKVVLSVFARTMAGDPVSWRQIAETGPDTPVGQQRAAWVSRVEAYQPYSVTFSHEPETGKNTVNGTVTDFIAMWRRVRQDFRATPATDPRFMLIHTAYAYAVPTTDRRYAPKWYPGDWYVDAIAVDAYNWHSCPANGGDHVQPWVSLRDIIEPFRRYGTTRPGKPLWLAEYGTVEHVSDPAAKGRWYRDAAAMFTEPAYAQFVGVSSFNPELPGCQWSPRSSGPSLDGYATFGQSAFGSP